MLARTKSKKRFGIWRTNFILTKKAVTKKNSRKPTRPTLFCLMIKNAPSMIPTAGCFLVEVVRRVVDGVSAATIFLLIWRLFLKNQFLEWKEKFSLPSPAYVIFVKVVALSPALVKKFARLVMAMANFTRPAALSSAVLPVFGFVILAVVRVRCRKKNVRSVAVWV